MNAFYEFATFRVDKEKRLLWNNDEAIRLKPKTFDTLLFLLENRHKIITKEEIIYEVWKGTAVSDDSLTQQISQIRKVLDDREHRIIATVPGIGYEFVADVCPVNLTDGNNQTNTGQGNHAFAPGQSQIEISKVSDENSQIIPLSGAKQPVFFSTVFRKKSWGIWAAAVLVLFSVSIIAAYFWQKQNVIKPMTSDVKKIAVLPFKSFNQDSESEVVKMVLTDSLITKISGLEQIKVLPTSAVSRYTNPNQDPLAAGRELKVDAILEGRLQKEGERLRVTAQLIKVSDGTTIWAESYNEDFSSFFDIQSELARKITEALSLELSSAEKGDLIKKYTNSPEAYRLWLEGRDVFNAGTADSSEIARKNFYNAIKLDPDFALPYVSLANTYMLSVPENLTRKEALLKAKELARQAIKIDETLPDAYTSYAFAAWRSEWNWQEAEVNFQRAVNLRGRASNIYSWYTMLLIGQGKFDRAVTLIQQSPIVDNPIAPANMGYINVARRDFDKSLELFQQAQTRIPLNHSVIIGLVWSYAGKGEYEKALELVEKALTLNDKQKNDTQAIKAFVLAKAGRKNEARQILRQLKENSDTESNLNGGRAVVYAALGEKDKAFGSLENAIEEREWWCYLLKVHFMYDSLRGDPRFEKMLRQVNLEN